ncbi:MAG: methyltransferase domain-containing protein [Spirochaetia bacterium]|uniref:class I SAM-dependent methyltransferase n=1 Tax=Sphaerochaeta sp. TaxID=1972642 RepID=UPI001D89038C|nr:methyltransferase domain-containing protein [Spirochaetia bacterium]NCC89219.1 methyltransferase domain-containing protein [Spirochaetia bacterium]
MSDPWYVQLFKNYAHSYENEPFTQGTVGECDFLEQELGYNKSLSILDVGCGTGRHTIELTKRGYRVTGIDLSENQLELARSHAAQEHLDISFLQADARDLPFQNEFDAAIMLCEGGFCLMESDEENAAILQSIARALKDTALLVLTTLNGLFPLSQNLNAFYADAKSEEGSTCTSTGFDLLTLRDHNTTTFTDDDGNEHTITSSERYYLPPEIRTLLTGLGFTTVEFFGSHLGAFSRDHALTQKDFEMLVVARKSLTPDTLVNLCTQACKAPLSQAYKLILQTLTACGKEMQKQLPHSEVSALYPGYLDMSYVAITPPSLKKHQLKLALVYLHERGTFELWLAGRNRSIQARVREQIRGKLPSPYELVEEAKGEDAIVRCQNPSFPDFSNPDLLIAHLCGLMHRMLQDVTPLLA